MEYKIPHPKLRTKYHISSTFSFRDTLNYSNFSLFRTNLAPQIFDLEQKEQTDRQDLHYKKFPVFSWTVAIRAGQLAWSATYLYWSYFVQFILKWCNINLVSRSPTYTNVTGMSPCKYKCYKKKLAQLYDNLRKFYFFEYAVENSWKWNTLCTHSHERWCWIRELVGHYNENWSV